jgi:hypothetical protein
MSADARARRARKQRLYRQRQRDRLAVLRVEAGDDLTAALIVAGRLSESEALNRREIERAVGEVLADLSQRWLQEKGYR